MSVLDAITSLASPIETKVPADVKERLDRGRDQLDTIKPQVRNCYEFWRGRQYCHVNDDRKLVWQSTVTNPDGSGKPRHRVRNAWNLIHGIVEAKVSQSTQRVPSYEILPSTTDPEDVTGAQFAEKAALYGYDKWRLRRVTVKCVTHALVGGEGFAMPYFDSTVPPYIQDGVGIGEIRVRTFSKREVGWEPGCEFEDSRWFFVQQARSPQDITDHPDYLGGNLKPDADEGVGRKPKLILVTEYFERPCPDIPDGRWITICNDRMVLQPQAYPCADADGNVIDEPVLHRISYTVDPDEDRDRSLVEHLLDPQRSYNDCNNKITEWKNLALIPQWMAPQGSLGKQRRTDEPGATYVYRPVAGQKPEPVQVPPIPPELFTFAEAAKGTMYDIAAMNDLPAGVDAAAAIQAVIERDNQRWQSFIADLAVWHGRLMRHCLYLVQRHYTEPRDLKIQGAFGVDLIPGFKGADLMGQADIRVMPGSLTSLSREEIRTHIQWVAQNFPGWLSPEAALAALNGGVAESLIRSYENDVGRANQVIQWIKAGPKVLFNLPDQVVGPPPVDPVTGQPTGGPQMVPGWMPRPFDKVSVHKQVFGDWMKSQDFPRLEAGMQAAAMEVWNALEHMETDQAVKAQQQQQQMAQGLGLANAAKPQDASPMPSLPNLGGSP